MATITPVVSITSTSVAENAGTVTITGYGFDSLGSNSVVFNDGAVEDTVTNVALDGTSITVSLTTNPTTAGPLTAVVTTNGASSGLPVQVAAIAPVVTGGTQADLLANTSTITITGFGFDTTAANDSVTFTDGAGTAAGTVTSVNQAGTRLTVAFTTDPTLAGPLDAVVSVGPSGSQIESNSDTPFLVATIQPVVTSCTTDQAVNATTVTINGFGFSTNTADDAVTFSGAAAGGVAAGTVTGTPTANQLTVTFSTKPDAAGELDAVVSVGASGSQVESNGGTAEPVATVTPIVTANSGNILAADGTSVTILGAGFSSTAADDLVTFNDGAVAGTVSGASATSLTVALNAPASATDPTTAGALTAVVEVVSGGNDVSSGAPETVATVAPVVTGGTVAYLPANATTLTITGYGFDPATTNSLSFNDGVSGSVTAVTATSLVVALTETPNTTIAGPLTVVVTTDNESSAPVQVTTLQPVVTTVTTDQTATTTSVGITGYGFNYHTFADNLITFNGAAAGTGVVTGAANATSLTVKFGTLPTAGPLTAIVTTNGQSSGSAVQVATVDPVVLPNLNYKPTATATTLLINGDGFDTSGTNTVALSGGAVVSGVTATTANLLTVTLTAPTTAGNLTAVVTTDGASSASEQVATVTPIVTGGSPSNLPAGSTSMTISGSGFDPTAANDSVSFTDGTGNNLTGTVTAASTTSLSVTFNSVPTIAGPLTAVVTVGPSGGTQISSGVPFQVATVAPAVTSSAANLAANASQLLISGTGFDPAKAHDSVTFTDGSGTAVGYVSAVNAGGTLLTVTFSTMPTAVGDLYAQVTSDNVSSGTTPVQVATVVPAVTSSAASQSDTITHVTISGYGFTTGGVNSVVFSSGAATAVDATTANSITYAFSTQPTAGNLTAVITTAGQSSGTPVQVATILPVVPAVNTGAYNLPANAATMTISGSGFDPTPANNLISFNDGAHGTVTAVSIGSPDSLTVTFSTDPTTAGSLTAAVTTDGALSGAPVQVATVIPVVTSSNTTLAANGNTLTINGYGFDPTASHDAVTFNDGAVATVNSGASATSLTVTFLTEPSVVGNLTATVFSDGVSSGTTPQVAAVTPAVFNNGSYQLAADAGSVNINGAGFDSSGTNTVAFNDGAVASSVTVNSPTSLTVDFATKPVIAGNLTAVVTTDNASSGQAVTVATVAPFVSQPNPMLSIAANAPTIQISGDSGFNPTASGDSVTFSGAAQGSVIAATTTSLTARFTTPPTAGSLTAIVYTNLVPSGTAVPVATVTPVVSLNTTALPVTTTNDTITISGYGFDTVTKSNNTVTFNDGAIGTVTGAAAGTGMNPSTLTVTFSTLPTAGSLTAVVTTDGQSSGTPVQVATVTPAVTGSGAGLLANAATLTISGFGFDPIASHNAVAFSGQGADGGAAGIVTGASANTLTVKFTTPPTGGTLNAIVTTDGASSTAVGVADVSPVVTNTSASLNLAVNAATLTITGYGFDPTLANDSVALSSGGGTLTTATPTSLTYTFSTAPTALGSLTATVSVGPSGSRVSSATVPVAKVIPVVTAAAANNLAINAGSVVINGFGFSSTIGNDTVTFNDGAAGTVSAASATSLTVTFSSEPTAGNLTATVSVGPSGSQISSGMPVQVATVAPVVTVTTTSLAANANTVIISGSGFDPRPGNNKVVFNDAVGTVVGATATALTVAFSTDPVTAGSLTAVVTTDGASSGTAVQVAAVTPVVTSSTAYLARPRPRPGTRCSSPSTVTASIRPPPTTRSPSATGRSAPSAGPPRPCSPFRLPPSPAPRPPPSPPWSPPTRKTAARR